MSALPEIARCPDCGTELVSEPGIPGLCPQCLLSLALLASPVEAEESEAPTLEGPSAGRLLGERYQVRELLGQGGMGEVYRAFDLKLRVDVALKAVRTGKVEAQRGVAMLRREVRAAREVVSPNVCRVFDLVEEEGREYVSMEYVDGTTLGDVLKERRGGKSWTRGPTCSRRRWSCPRWCRWGERAPPRHARRCGGG
jgi:hypothetical protein